MRCRGGQSGYSGGGTSNEGRGEIVFMRTLKSRIRRRRAAVDMVPKLDA